MPRTAPKPLRINNLAGPACRVWGSIEVSGPVGFGVLSIYYYIYYIIYIKIYRIITYRHLPRTLDTEVETCYTVPCQRPCMRAFPVNPCPATGCGLSGIAPCRGPACNRMQYCVLAFNGMVSNSMGYHI